MAHMSGLSRLASYALAGVAGDLLVRGAKASAPAARRLLVGGVAGGIRVGRWLEEAAEEARLKLGDVTAEARQQLGEDSRPAATPRARRSGASTTHEH
jgi:Protein of unknown function (DUF1490)